VYFETGEAMTIYNLRFSKKAFSKERRVVEAYNRAAHMMHDEMFFGSQWKKTLVLNLVLSQAERGKNTCVDHSINCTLKQDKAMTLVKLRFVKKRSPQKR
jgi:hypothetical protein